MDIFLILSYYPTKEAEIKRYSVDLMEFYERIPKLVVDKELMVKIAAEYKDNESAFSLTALVMFLIKEHSGTVDSFQKAKLRLVPFENTNYVNYLHSSITQRFRTFGDFAKSVETKLQW